MSAPVVLGVMLGVAAVLALVGAAVIGIGARGRRWYAVWTAIVAVGLGLYAVSVGQEFRSMPLDISALVVLLVGAVGLLAEAVRALRAVKTRR